VTSTGSFRYATLPLAKAFATLIFKDETDRKWLERSTVQTAEEALQYLFTIDKGEKKS
jgi:hypothetical protein